MTIIVRSPLWAVALLAFSVAAARAQQANISYVALNSCCIAQDGQGNDFIVSSSAFPLETHPADPTAQATTITVVKMDASGNVISKFAFQAGNDGQAAAAAVDPLGNLWIVGSVAASAQSNPTVGLIAKLDSTGTHLLYSGTFGGLNPTGDTAISAIAFDPAGNPYLAGSTSQSDFPSTPGALIGAIPSAAAGQEIFYGFIAKLTPASQTTPPYTLGYSTLLGGQQASTFASVLAVDANGLATVSGTTSASDFPVTPGAFQTQLQGGANDVFITRLNAQGTSLVWSTLLGAAGFPTASLGGIALDSSGNVVLAGITAGPNFPITSGAIQPQPAAPQSGAASLGDGFVAKLDSTGGSLLFSTYYGIASFSGSTGGSPFISNAYLIGSNFAPPRLRLDAQGDIWITESLADPPRGVGFNAPVSTGFVLRQPRATPTGVPILGVADAAANAVNNAVAPGEYVSIYGTGLGPATGAGMQLDPSGVVASSLGGTQVSFDGVFAPLIYVSENQINLLVPYEVAGSAQVNMMIATSAGSSQTLPLQVVAEQPNIFAVLNADGSINSSSNPVSPGDTVSILVSGAGALNPRLPDGTIAASPTPAPASTIQVDFYFTIFEGFSGGIGTLTATPAYAGGIPGMVIDLLRVDVPVPANLVIAGPPPFGIGVAVGNSTSPTLPFYVAVPSN